MDKYLALFADTADAEFGGDSFNGPSLMATLECLTPDMAAYDLTHEGYSAWEIALHLAYFKHFIAKALDPGIEAYPLPKGPSGFGTVPVPTQEAWRELLDYLRAIHSRVMQLVRAAPESRFDEPTPRWEVPIGKAVAWLFTHDTYHTAQLRNMGVPGLKEPKEV
jgi:uncharacterized damage-inducible protein DinB